MADHLCITVRFLQGTCHGRGERGEPEWPPSPLRVFQSLIAAAVMRWNERERLESAVPALRWLERQNPPAIVAGRGRVAESKYRLYVPDNTGDTMILGWSRGEKSTFAKRTEKDVRPIYLRDGEEAVHYLWPLHANDPELDRHRSVLVESARSLTHLGWGVDMVAAHAAVIGDDEADRLSGERWRPTESGSAEGLRVPVEGTVDALIEKHEAFLDRIGPDNLFRPVPPLSAFDVVNYRRETDPPAIDFEAFSLLTTDAGGLRPFDTARLGLRVAGMLRHAAKSDEIARAMGWAPERVARFVLGHGESPGESPRPVGGPRLAFFPLPSIEPRGPGRPMVVTSIRRALVAVLGGPADGELRRLGRLLSGSDLIREDTGEHVAMLSTIAKNDRRIAPYTGKSATWATVTQVILPGHDDPRKLRRRLFGGGDAPDPSIGPDEQRRLLETLDRRIEALLRKAIVQAGFSPELARHAEIDWRTVGFWPGTEPASRYGIPDHLRRQRRLHVEITWRDRIGRPIALRGPICLGGGRFLGLGLFAARDSRHSEGASSRT